MAEASRPQMPAALHVQAYAGALAMVGAATLVGLWIAPRWGTAPVDMIYLPAVLGAAALWGLGPALLAGTGAALSYNFFFTAPIHSFRMDRVTDIVTVAVLLIVALVTSKLAADIRAQAQLAASHASRNATIAGFARRLLSSSTEEGIGSAACGELNRLFGCNAMLVAGLAEPHTLATVPSGNRLTPSDLAAAALVLETGEPAGRGTPRIQPAEWVFHAVRAQGSVLADIGLARDDGAPAVSSDGLILLENLLDQLALALVRARAESEARELNTLRERDRVRAGLLASIREDLSAPIAALGSAARQLRRSPIADKELSASVSSQSLKLERYVANLLELEPDSDREPVQIGPVTIDLFHRSVLKNGREVHLTPKEYLVVAELAKHRGRVLTHGHLLRTAWGPAQESQTEYLRVAIRALRQKLEVRPSDPRLILNEPGVGYRLVAQ
jgi:two-component system sensor histidine kinase KdpD